MWNIRFKQNVIFSFQVIRKNNGIRIPQRSLIFFILNFWCWANPSLGVNVITSCVIFRVLSEGRKITF